MQDILTNQEVSIILPTFNEEKNIKGALEALIKQITGISYEIIVVDSSEDETTALIEKNFPAIVLIRNERQLSCGEARNIGIRHALGKKILFTDADVRVPSDWVEGMSKNLDKLDICAGPVRNGTPHSVSGTIGYLLEFWRFLPCSTVKKLILGGNTGYRRSYIENLNFTSGVGEDLIFNYLLLKNTKATITFDSRLAVIHLNKTGLRKVFSYQIKLGEGAYQYRKQLGLKPQTILNFPFLVYLVPFLMIPQIVFKTIWTRNYLLSLFSFIFLPLLFIGNYFWAYGFYKAARKA